MEDLRAEGDEGRGSRLGTTIFQLALVVPMLAYLAIEVTRRRSDLTPAIAFFILAVAVVDLIPVPGWGGLQLSLSFPVLLGVAILYPPAIAAFVTLVGSFDPREFRREIPPLTALWNRSQMALSILVGGALFHRVAEADSSWARVLAGVLLAGVVAYAVNTLAVAAQIAVDRRASMRRVVANMHGTAPYEFLLAYVGLGLFGAVIAHFYRSEGAWSVVALLTPLVFARQMYFRSRGLADRLAEQNTILADQARKLEELLESEHHTVDELRELNRMKGEFVAVVSHELRTPVTALLGYAKTLRQPAFAEDRGMREEFLERMERQGDRLVRLIENLLTASRIEAHELPLSLSRIVFADLVREVLEGLSPQDDRIRVAVPPDLPALRTDRHLLGRVLSNLLDNALKYSPDGSPCELGARADRDHLVFWVQDHGVGIPPDELPRIFERFYQVDSSSTRTFRGAGLGLSLVRDLLDHIGGTIDVESAPGQGSRFTVTMPVDHPRSATEAAEVVHDLPMSS